MDPQNNQSNESLFFNKKYFAEQYVDNSATAIIAIDLNQNIIIYNQVAEDIMGIPAIEMLGRPFKELLNKKDGTQDSILLNTLRTGKPYSHLEASIDTPLGIMSVMAYTTLVRDENGGIIGGILSIRDITSQKQLEEKVTKAEKFAVIGELAAGIAHEVRNPLTSVHGFLQLLEKKFDSDDSIQRYINIMLDEINRINYIISEFLLLSRPTVPIKRDVNIHDVLEEIMLLTEGEFTLKDIELFRNYDCKCPNVTIDVEQIKQVFLNLFSNSIAAMPSGGRFKVSTSYDSREKTISLSFADTGVGIEISQARMIFDPFFTTKAEGTGLGLTVSYRIVENHGGKIEVESTPGEGSTFTVTLPAIIF